MIIDENFMTALILIATAGMMMIAAGVYFYPSARHMWRRQMRHMRDHRRVHRAVHLHLKR